jgi:hypothetical protein
LFQLSTTSTKRLCRRGYRREKVVTTDELVQLLDRLKATMIAVATGGPRIGDVEGAFARDYDKAAIELERRRIQNPLPYRDLWDWYGRWSSGDMPSWQSRRQFVNGLFNDLLRTIQAQQENPLQERTVEPTGWSRVDRNVTEVRKRLETASTEEQFQAVALLCRETLISIAQEVFDPTKHPTRDGVAASASDAKRMLEAYIATEFAGDANEHIRKHARAAYDLSAQLQHRRTATFRDAAACAEATTSLVNLIAIMAGLRDPH